MKVGQKLDYFGKSCEVVDFNSSHVLIKFKSGSKLCTPKTTFHKDYK